jgi:hypothetical protein
VQEQNRKISINQLLGYLALVGLFVVLFVVFVDLPVVGQQLRMADLRYLLASSFLLITGLLAYAVRWQKLLANKPTLLYTFHTCNLGHSGNFFIPARGGVIIRILAMGSGEVVSTTEATTGYVVERLFEQAMRLFALIGAILLGVGIKLTLGSMLGGIVALSLVFSGILWLIRHPETAKAKGTVWLARLPWVTEARANKSLTDLLDNLTSLSSLRRLASILLWSFICWFCFWGFFLLTSMSLDPGFSPDEVLPVTLGALFLSPPSAPTQPGVFHGFVVAPLAAVGYSAETLTAYTVILHILEMIWMTAFAVWGLVQLRITPRTWLTSFTGEGQ